jgi:splicing factor 3B subunit 3
VAEFEADEVGLAVCCATFTDRPEEQFVVVSGAKGLRPQERKAESSFFSVFQIVDEGQGPKLRLLHKTLIDELCYAIAPFQGRLLAGVGHTIRIYDLGKRKMLRKTENKNIPNFVKTIHTEGDRIIVGDVSESFHYCKYKRPDQIIIFADDYTSRWLTSGEMVDYDTMVAADKFGNLSVVRLPAEVSEDVEEDPTGARFKFEQGALNGAPHKLTNVAQFHVGETVMKVQKAALMPGGHEALLYATVLGGIGALLPFTSREDVDFFAHLEMALRQENPPMMGRDHLGFRGAYTPVKNVLDGDMCEQYGQLEPAKQRTVASELDRTPAEIAKKLEDIRNKIL